jgi:hypothetical protein
MKKYNFLFKPLFFICSLIFATWMVLKIEKLSPSDFGRHRSLFETSAEEEKRILNEKLAARNFLKDLCDQYKRGSIDSTRLRLTLEGYLGFSKKKDE